jgi:hypothetical protein
MRLTKQQRIAILHAYVTPRTWQIYYPNAPDVARLRAFFTATGTLNRRGQHVAKTLLALFGTNAGSARWINPFLYQLRPDTYIMHWDGARPTYQRCVDITG